MVSRKRKVVDITKSPELLRLVQEMQQDDTPISLRDESREVAVLLPSRRPGRSRLKGKPTDDDDPIWEIVGMIDAGGPGDVAENVDAYLAEANLHRNS